jgi:hypothetical protein
MSYIDDWTLDEAVKEMDFDDDALKNVSDFEYQGFNPEGCFKKLKAHAKTANRQKEYFVEDMSNLVLIMILRGTNLIKIKQSMSDKGQVKLEELRSRYKLQTKANKPDDVTLQRVASLFPGLMQKAMKASGHQSIVTDTVLPAELRFTQAPALLPPNSRYKSDWEDWYKKFTVIINRKNKNFKESEIDAEHWWQIYNTKSIVSMIARNKYERKLSGEPTTPTTTPPPVIT